MSAVPTGSCLEHALLSVIIKTLNEEKKIGTCIESVLNALKEIKNPSEIIIADSLSSDKTVEVAAGYPVKIVQFENAEDRGCGAGVQLGYQHSTGELILLLDGDMTLLPGFLPMAIAAMENDECLGGVAGLMEEVAIRNAFDAHRVASKASSSARTERWLNGGGLYRRNAIETAGGYAADRNLKGWEEAELGMRLRAAGWVLKRFAINAVRHNGHKAGTWEIIFGQWRSQRLMSNGVIVRSAFGKPWFFETVSLFIFPIMTGGLWVVTVIAAIIDADQARLFFLYLVAAIWFCIAGLLFIRKGGVISAMHSIAIWHINAVALVFGLFFGQKPTNAKIGGIVFPERSN